MDRCLSEVLGRKALAAHRPRMDELVAWFTRRSDLGDCVEACVFATVAAGNEARLAPWVSKLRQWGWSVFVRPKHQHHDLVTDVVARHVEHHFRHGNLGEVVIASHNVEAFGEALRRYTQSGVSVTVLGFREHLAFDHLAADVHFVDLEDLPGVFTTPLPRTNLLDLPSGGRWFQPLEPLQATLAHTPTSETQAPVPDFEPDRTDVVSFLREAINAAPPAGLKLQAAGNSLRQAFPGFSLDGSGFSSVRDLLKELQAGGDIRITGTEHGHLLVTADPKARFTAPLRRPGQADTELGDEQIINLTDRRMDPELPAVSTERGSPPDKVGSSNPIYRLFGFDPDTHH